MKIKTFELTIPPNADRHERFQTAYRLAEANDIAVNGDAEAGTFSGRFAGSWFTTGDKVHVTLTRRPALIPTFAIKQAVQKFLNGWNP